MNSESPLLVCLVGPEEAIDSALLRNFAAYEECGAIVTFEGVVRLTEEGRSLEALTYEHHDGMALPELEKVCRNALERFSIRRVACAHRVGRVPVGEASIMVVVGADHRAPAFEACQFIMDTLKRSVPIWKAPLYGTGS